jgi:hypothetical protein
MALLTLLSGLVRNESLQDRGFDGSVVAWLSFVRLLPRADESLYSFGGFDALLLLEFIYPVGDIVHHIGRGFARGLAGRPGSAGLPLATLGALNYSYYFFLRHIQYSGTGCFYVLN